MKPRWMVTLAMGLIAVGSLIAASAAQGPGRWTTAAPMPAARHGLGAVAVRGRVFVVSGGPRPGGSYSGANEVFTP